jgi:hypothetical protein
MKAFGVILVLLTPALASANDPMMGWYLQQQARGRVSGRGPSRPTGVLARPLPSLRKKPTVQPAAAEEKAPEKKTVEPAPTECSESTTPEASAKPTQGPGVAYQLGRMVRRMLDAVGSASAKRTAAQVETAPERSAKTSTSTSEERAAPFALGSPRPAQKASSPGALFLLRKAHLITEADYQTGLLRFLGAR